VRAMFDRIAPRYQRLNTVLTFGLDRGWRRAAIAAAQLHAGDLVVDVACGTGDLAALAAAVGARAIGVDFAPAMLARACGRGAALVRGDAAALPLRPACADAVTCGFALRNVVEIAAVLAEAARVLRPGGRLVLLEIAAPRRAARRWLHRAYFHRLVPSSAACSRSARRMPTCRRPKPTCPMKPRSGPSSSPPGSSTSSDSSSEPAPSSW